MIVFSIRVSGRENIDNETGAGWLIFDMCWYADE